MEKWTANRVDLRICKPHYMLLALNPSLFRSRPLLSIFFADGIALFVCHSNCYLWLDVPATLLSLSIYLWPCEHPPNL